MSVETTALEITIVCRTGIAIVAIQLHAATIALVHEDARDPFGMVDERVAIALKAEYHVVAIVLNVVHGVLDVPLQQHGQDAHVGDGFILARVAGSDERLELDCHRRNPAPRCNDRTRP